MKSDVVLFGTGSLARSVTYSLTTMAASTSLRVLIVGRSRDDGEEVASVAQGRAGATAQPHVFDTVTANWADVSVAGDILHTHRPTVTIVTASEQSPWELADDANAWAQLVKRGGFGLTLPFNASLASQVFRAANATEPRPFFINACYPDAVNSLLAALGPSDRLIGVGNAAIIESLYRATSRHQKTVRVVAHHRHLAELSAGDEALVDDRPFSGSVPGPLGEVGGYPVTLKHGAIAIDLPPGLSMAAAREVNSRAALREGVVVRDGAAHFSAAARDALLEHGYSFADGFIASRLSEAIDELRILRERLTGTRPGRR
jgi:hypothetical protein